MAKNMKPTEKIVEDVSKATGNTIEKEWIELGLEIINVVDKSNAAYGNSTEKSAQILQILWPNGVPVDRMHDFRCMVSIIDKLCRIATDKDAFGECAFRDIAGYAVLGYRHDLETHKDRER